MRVEMHEVEELGGPVVDAVLVLEAVRARGVEELFPDADDRVERVERSLEDHGAFGPAVLAEVIVIELADVAGDAVLRVEDLACGHSCSPRREPDEADR